jgi:hypothetical protein
MSINYVLLENHLTSDPDDYMAMVHTTGTADLGDVIDRIIERGSTVTRADIVSVLEDYYAAIENLVLEGLNVNTPGANYGASIKGVFDGRDDAYDAARHQVEGAVSPGRRFRKCVRERARVSKLEQIRPKPNPTDYYDIVTGQRNSVLTPGAMGRVVGHRLKFDAEDPAQGIFFVAADGSEMQVTLAGRNKPSELIFTVPQGLAPGAYALEVRATINGGVEIRTGRLEAPLNVD